MDLETLRHHIAVAKKIGAQCPVPGKKRRLLQRTASWERSVETVLREVRGGDAACFYSSAFLRRFLADFEQRPNPSAVDRQMADRYRAMLSERAQSHSSTSTGAVGSYADVVMAPPVV